MLQLNHLGKIVSWGTNDGNIITPRDGGYGVWSGGSEFFAPYNGRPHIDDRIWKDVGVRPTEQSHLKYGEGIFQKMSVDEVRKRQHYHFSSAGSRDYPWKYSAVISAKEYPPNKDASYGLSYDLTTTRQESCTNEHMMPYRVALRTFFALKDCSYKFTVGDIVIADETQFALGCGVVLFNSLKDDRLETAQLVSGNRTISISCMGVDDVMLWLNDEAGVCIELVYGAKHDKALAPGEDHQLLCGLVVTHD